MGLQSELTFLHMKASTAIDRIERDLRRWSLDPTDQERSRRINDELASVALRLRRDLEAYFAREKKELLPRVQRIFGSSMSEVKQLVQHQGMVLTALDRFIVTLTDEVDEDLTSRRIHLSQLEQLFDEFVERYEARSDADRSFYQTYSTVLYPGGLATE